MKKGKSDRTVIKLIDGYTCEIDSNNNYILVKHWVSGKGKPASRNLGYYSGLQGALERLGDELAIDGIRGSVATLDEAVAAIRESKRKLSKLLMEVLETGGKK